MLQNMSGKIRLDVWPCSSCGSAEVRSNFDLRNSPYVGNWNHIAVSFNGANEVKFYINGSLDSTKYLSQSGLNTDTPPLEIGSVEGIGQIKANLGAFRISNGVKTSFPYGSYANVRSEPTLAAGGEIDPPETGSSNLAILGVRSYPYSQGGVLIEVDVENQGDLSTQNEFYTDIYLDHLPVAPGDFVDSMRFWVSQPIGPGEIRTLSSILTSTSVSTHIGSDTAITEVTGVVYAQVDSVGAITESDEGDNIYSLGMPVCVASQDGYEGDDEVASASEAVLGQAQVHNFDRPGDVDWIQFSASSGQKYRMSTFDLDFASDTKLELFAQDGTTPLRSNDDFGGSLASQIDWMAASSGTYHLKVTHWSENESGCGTSYSVSIIELHDVFMPVIVR